jgi:small redox-active disulfide protein 2
LINIKILGNEITECQELEDIAREAAHSMGIEIELEYVTDNDQIMEYPIITTPGLVIQGELVSYGRIPEKSEIENWLKESV